jgi:hypothetical protein
MNLDKRVITAINEAVEEAGETPALAQKIVAWIDSLAGGNARLSDRDSTERHLELLYRNVVAEADEDRAGG